MPRRAGEHGAGSVLHSDKTLKQARVLSKRSSELTSDAKSDIRRMHRAGHPQHTIQAKHGPDLTHVGFYLKVKRETGITMHSDKRAHRGEDTGLGSNYGTRNKEPGERAMRDYRPKTFREHIEEDSE